MALNYSHRPVFPAHISEENLVSPVRIVNGSSESTSKDIVDLLPSDPFGMDIKTTFTAITGWLEDLEVDCGGTSQLNEKMNVGMQSVPSNLQYGKYIYGGTVWGERLAPYDIGFQPSCNMGEIVGFRNESDSCDSELQSGKKVEGAANFEGVPHEALAFALSYLGVKDLLSVERVCKSLLSTVRGDPLLWMTIHIDQPLNERITDDVLVQLASRAQVCVIGIKCGYVFFELMK
ncbi:F-box protein SKIP14, partial [Sesamum angolense]